MAAVLTLSACGQQGGSGDASQRSKQNSEQFEDMSADDHIRCAALISAYQNAMMTGSVSADQGDSASTLETMMWHLNAYAIPQGISEQEAFAKLESERSGLISVMSPADIEQEASACMDVVNT